MTTSTADLIHRFQTRALTGFGPNTSRKLGKLWAQLHTLTGNEAPLEPVTADSEIRINEDLSDPIVSADPAYGTAAHIAFVYASGEHNIAVITDRE